MNLSPTQLSGLDRIAVGLSALCGLHCVATTLLVGVMASLGTVLESPLIHEGGLFLAILLGALSLGAGALRHGSMLPVAIGSLGLGVMAGALSHHHSPMETVYTLMGVAILSLGHLLNRGRHVHGDAEGSTLLP
ncbi:MAG TPA: MerC domain-containing protein [Sphingobium sp.]|uniref:MerC domain-containing protein n=1 Tax=Sphingobium sp. TaxID=1912891 RepID=UPI002ED2182E